MQEIPAVASDGMPGKPQRGRSVPCPPWWIDKVKKILRGPPKIPQKLLAEHAGVSESAITRLLNGEVTTLELIGAVSGYLKIENPVSVAASESDARRGEATAPTTADPVERVIQKNLVRFREEAGFDRVGAADASAIPFETLTKYEGGELEVPNAVLKSLAEVYGRRPGDFFEVDPPPADLSNRPGIWFRGRPEVVNAISDEDRARLDNLMREIDEKYRPLKQKQADATKGRERRSKR